MDCVTGACATIILPSKFIYTTICTLNSRVRSLFLAGTALTLKTVFNALHSVCHQWFSIGLQLDVPISRLNIIETDKPGAEEWMSIMLNYWLNNATDPLPSWKVLVDALKAPTVCENKLAKELEEIYCSPADRNSLGESDDL